MSVHFLSMRDDWETPQFLFDGLNAEFGFEIDVCATKETSKCSRFFTREEDALSQPWTGVCWVNPPYGRGMENWLEKAFNSSLEGALVVCLLPARTDTRWWHRFVNRASEVRFLKGRLKFDNAKNSAPFPSCIVVFRPPKCGSSPTIQSSN